MTRRLTDKEIIERARKDDPDAFGELVTRYHRQVANLVYRIVGDYELTADLVQEVFVRTYRALDRYDGRYKFFSWLMRIAHNLAINHVRKRRLPTDALSEVKPPATKADGPSGDPAQSLLADERRRQLHEAIESIPEKYRVALLYRYWYELSYREIARIMGTKETTVRSHLNYGRRLLRERLEGKV